VNIEVGEPDTFGQVKDATVCLGNKLNRRESESGGLYQRPDVIRLIPDMGRMPMPRGTGILPVSAESNSKESLVSDPMACPSPQEGELGKD
jgi:hypothetical protein